MAAVDAPAPLPRLSGTRKIALLGVPALLAAGMYSAAIGLVFQTPPPVETIATGPEPDGAKLFLQHCAYCHGPHGDGNGVAGLNPKARYFGWEKYKFGSTQKNPNGIPIPTDDDLLAVMRNGIAGSAMPAFGYVPDADLRAIVSHLRSLTWQGTYARLADADADEGIVDPIKWSNTADLQTQLGKPLPVPERFQSLPPPTPEGLARGKVIFTANCASCHGADGKGEGPQTKDLKNENKTPARPRDLTQGLFKGGKETGQIYLRLVLGIPGTPMGEFTKLSPDEMQDLLHYVLSLSGR